MPDFEDSDFLTTARERFHLAQEAESQFRAQALDDTRYAAGEQWPNEIKAARNRENRPCLTMNQIPQFLHQILNEQRKSRPAVQINPVSDATKSDAELRQGIVRHVELNSHADVCYDRIFRDAVVGGRGYARVITDYVDDDSNDQEIYVKAIRNPFTVYMDPAAEEADYADARWCFIVEDLSRDEYREQYGDSDPETAGLADFSSIGDNAPHWATKDTIRVAEYFWVETSNAKRKGKRGKKRTVKWCKMNAFKKLDERTLPVTSIPVVPCLGIEEIIDGEVRLKGIVHDMRDAQSMYNFWNTAATEMIALAPKAPWIGTEKQFANHPEWDKANVVNYSKLTYNADPATPARPGREVAEPPIQAITVALRQASEDLRNTTGMYAETLGRSEADKSGKAITALQNQGNTATFHFIDNLSRTIQRIGQLVNEYIPVVYDTPRIIQTVAPDGTRKAALVINGDDPNSVDPALLQAANGIIHDTSKGRFSVTVSTGQTYQTKREQAFQMFGQMAQAWPELLQLGGDIIMRNSDVPGAEQLADRLEKALPPGLQPQKDGPQPPLPPQIQQIVAQHPQLVQQVHQLSQVIETKQVEQQAKNQGEMAKLSMQYRIAELNAKVALLQTEATVNAKLAQLNIQRELGIIDNAHEAGSQAVDHMHELHMQQAQAEQAQQQQASDQQFQAQSQGAQQEHEQNQAQFQVDNAPEPSGE